MPLPVSAEETSYGSILQTENARQSVEGEENTEDPENQDKENARGSENQDKENAGGSENQDKENAGGSEDQDKESAGGSEDQDKEGAGGSEDQDKESAGGSEDQDKESAGGSEDQDKESAGDSENQDKESAGDSEDEEEDNSSEITRTIIVTGFEELEEAVMYQQLAIGAKEKAVNFPDELTVTVRIQTKSGLADGEAASELSDITWKLDEEESDGTVFDSSKACNGYCYVYTPVLPETDADGNSIQVAEDTELPMIYVLIGRQQVMALSADHYDKDGFCSGYELKGDGTWARKEGDAACTAEGCCGYQPADLTADQYDIDGNGSKDEVYEIGNAGQLYWFAGLVNGDTGVCTGEVTRNLSANAVLTADITVNESVLKPDGTLSDDTSGFRSWTPIGSDSEEEGVYYSYSGKFDGQSHTISGLYFNDPTEWSGVGLFGEAGSDAVISNVGVVDSYFHGQDDVGGICGFNYGTIRGSYNTGTVVAKFSTIGGVCGYNEGGVIANCYNAGSISGGRAFASGVCGENNSGTIKNCHNTGNVSGYSDVGGVCGRLRFDEETNRGTIRDSYNTGKITVTGSYSRVGGVCGYVWSGTILNSYNIGSVTATGSNGDIGGVCGQNDGTIANSHSTGNVIASDLDSSVGGVCGSNFNPGTIANCYFDSTICSGDAVGRGNGSATAAEGKATDQFAGGEVAWLLSQGCTIGEGDAAVPYDGSDWGQKLGEGGDTYPVLDSAKKVYKGYNGTCIAIYSNHQMDQTPVHSLGTDGFCQFCGEVYQKAVLTTNKYDIDGDGSKDEVYEIGNAGQLYWFAGLVNGDGSVCTDGVTQNYSANAVLTADITVNENVLKPDGTLSDSADSFRSWTPIGRVSANYYMGIFDGQSHTIGGLYFDDQEYESGSNVGLFGWSKGSISNVGIVDSYFSGNMYVGGVCGQSKGSISNCYHTGVVSGNMYVGGVCGDNGRTITNCYHAGIVNGSSSVGGVCGRNDGTTTDCYFDSTIYSGDAVGGGGGTAAATEGRTTAQFKSGEVAYLLSQGCAIWGQKLGEGGDTYPVLDSAKKVYMGYGESCKPPVYSNNESIVKPAPHQFDPDGFCTVCGAYQPADLTADHYEIGNAGQLYWFAGLVNGEESVCTEGATQNTNANAVLTEDITVNKNVLNSDGTPSDSTDGFRSWTPIGNNSNTAYSGCFDGQSHTISGLYFSNSDADYVGLFGTAGAGAVISNVGIRDSYFYGRSSVGAMCGKNSGTVTGCYNAGSVKGLVQHVSGVCGWNKGGTIRSCYNTGTVSGFGAGGVCGWNEGGTIRSCYNTGKVTASSWAGGVCELNSGTASTITGSYNTGEVSGGKAGGVCGENDGAITNSYNTGAVTAAGSACKAGGVCGYNDRGTLSSCYSAGNFTATGSDSSVGGVCGYNAGRGTIDNCCFDSMIYSGGAIGVNEGTATDTEGRITAQFASGEAAYLLNEGKTDGSQAWYQNIDGGTKDSLPVLDSTHGTVYIGDPCPYKYSNSDAEVPHSFFPVSEDDTQHKCTKCGHTEKHADVAEFTADPEAHSISARCSACGDLGKVTLSAAGAVYDGKDKAASVSGTIKGITVPAIVYERKNGEAYTEITGIPKDAGAYRAVITLGTGENAAAVTVEYTIQQAAPVITWNTPASVCYTGKAVTLEKLTTPDVTLVNGEVFKGQISYSYREQVSDAAFTEGLPTERGIYDVKAGIAADGNYTQAEKTITLTIEWLETSQKAALTDQGGKPLSGEAWWASGVTFTAPDGFTISDSLTGTYGASFTYDTETTAAGTTLTYYLKNSDGEIAEKSEAVRIDKTAPDWTGDDCGISVKENWWKSLLNSISFGLFYKEKVDVKVFAADSISGVAAYYYYIDPLGSTVRTAEELDKLSFTAHTNDQGKKPVTVTSLASDGSYLVYAYAVDAAGNRSAYVCSDGVVVDQTAPVISDVSTPAKNDSTLTDTGAKISFTGSEAGTYFYVLAETADNSSAPTSITDFAQEQPCDGYSKWTAKAGVSFAPMKADAGNEITLSGLKANTAYTLYLAAVDLAGNSTATVMSRGFTTCKTMPVIAAMPAISGIYGQTVSGMTLTGGRAEVQNSELAGTWTVTDTKASDMPVVGTTDSYTVTFEPEDIQYETVSVQVTPVVAKKPVTVTAENKTRSYGENNPAFTFTIPEGALAGSDTKEDLAVALSCPAAKDSPVKEGGYAITGTSSSVNYEVTITPGTLTITKAEARITVSATSYDKTFGDAPFALGVTVSNPEADVQYAVTAGSDVISVAGGTATILKAGDAEITVSLPASANYEAAASVKITVKVAKKSGYAAADIDKSYLYIADKEDIIDLSKYLPADCGAVTYGTPQITEALYTADGEPAISGDGRLSYTVKQADSAGADGTIKVTVATDNYEDFTITVKVKQVDKYPVSLKSGSSVTLKNSTLTYGEALSKLAFNSAVFVDENGKAVAGALAWKTPAATPAAGTTSAAWVFTPKDASYAAVEDTIAITVKKAAPKVKAVPTVAGRVYDPNQALTDADLTGGSVTGIDGKALAGVWTLVDSNIVPVVNNSGYEAVFTPSDTTNYTTAAGTIKISVTKASLYITEKPTAAAVTYGQTLAASALTGGRAAYRDVNGSEILGSFAWKKAKLKPAVSDSGVTEYEVTFIPSDAVNYNTAETKLTLTVNKADKAPNMPGSEMKPAHSTAKVGNIKLPKGWSWLEADKDIALSDGIAVTATAVYTGADKGNYETESVSIIITRSKCDHRNTEIRNRKDATSQAEGYTGDIYCKDCGILRSRGTVTDRLAEEAADSDTGNAAQPADQITDNEGSRDNENKTPVREADNGNKASENTDPGNADPGNTNPGQNSSGAGKEKGASQGSLDRKEPDSESRPYIRDDSGKEGWDAIKPQLEEAGAGEIVTVVMNGTTVVPKSILDSIKGEDVTLVLDMGNGLSWKIKGTDITEAAGDIDFGVTAGANAGKSIPVDVINNVTGERYSMNLTLDYSGEFGLTATLTINMEARNAGLYANLFYYNEQTGELEFVSAGQIDRDGNAELIFSHASDYTIVIDETVMDGTNEESAAAAEDTGNTGDETVPAKEADEEAHTWKPAIAIIIGSCILLLALGAVIYVRKRNSSIEKL